ncbi:MAG TPA: hypothetical protein VLH60_02180, partial [Sedimentisphaerales bacterium]|nr:hypothetical protein [Sedimentisphaerales bacterium]
CGGAMSLWRMSLDNPENQANHRQWLEEQLGIYVPKSFTMADEILYFWFRRTRDDSTAAHPSDDLYGVYVENVKQVMENPEKFVAALKQDMPNIWLLWHMVSRFRTKAEVKMADSAFFSFWQPWLPDVLEKATETDPFIVAMYVTPLVYDLDNIPQGRRRDGSDGADSRITFTWRVSFDGKVGEMLFGQRLNDMMRIIAALKEGDYSEYKTLDEQAKAILDYAGTHANTWLLDHPSSEV